MDFDFFVNNMVKLNKVILTLVLKLFITCFNRTKFLKNTQHWRTSLYWNRSLSFIPRKL